MMRISIPYSTKTAVCVCVYVYVCVWWKSVAAIVVCCLTLVTDQ